MVYDIAVVGGGIVGLGDLARTAAAASAPQTRQRRERAGLQQAPDRPQQRRDPLGDLLQAGLPESQALRRGPDLARAYCDEKNIPYKRVGKLIVATEESELGRLQELYERGQQNGSTISEILDARADRRARAVLPRNQGDLSPVTGIVDWGVVAGHYAEDAREAGADMYLGREVRAIDRQGGVTTALDQPGEIQAKSVMTCGGLYSDKLARMTAAHRDPKIVPFRGDYLILKPGKEHLVQGNIYPVPDPDFPFLGVHFTPRMDGTIWLGPNAVLAFAREGYRSATSTRPNSGTR